MPYRRPLTATVVLVATLAIAASGGLAPGASAKVHTVKPVRVAGGLVVYRLPKLRPAEVRQARLRLHGRQRPVSVKRMRHALAHRRLRVRVAPRRHVRRGHGSRRHVRRGHGASVVRRARQWRLIIVTRPAQRAVQAPQRPSAEPAWRPYSDSSPFNRELSAGGDVQVAQTSRPVVSRLMDLGGPGNLTVGDADTEEDWWHPVYWSAPADPEFILHCYESSWGRCSIEGMRVRVPDAARPAAGGDAHLTVVDRESGWEYDLYKVRSKPAGGGVLEFRWGGRTRIDGDGLGSGATVSGFGSLAGIVRGQELAAGEIRHALFMVVKCTNGEAVWPASGGAGTRCSDMGLSDADAPPMGTRFQLAMSDGEIAALGVPGWKQTLLRAMAHYGMYVGDTGGGSWGVQMESGSSYTSFGQEDPLVTFARRHGVPTYKGKYVLNLSDGVEWQQRLRVVDPCEGRGAC
jgi:hypothetical protein